MAVFLLFLVFLWAAYSDICQILEILDNTTVIITDVTVYL